MLKLLSIISLLALTSACSSLKFPFAYQLVIQQGNYVEQQMIDQLEVGMTRRQVKFVMGSPLIEDSFNADRWDYYYTVKRGEDQFTRKLFTVYFDGDKLARWDGDLRQINNNADGTQEEEKTESEGDIKPEDEDYMNQGTGKKKEES